LLPEIERIEPISKFRNWSVKPALSEMSSMKEIDRPGNMPGTRVKWFGITSISNFCARVDHCAPVLNCCDDLVSGHHPRPLRWDNVRRRLDNRGINLGRGSCCDPGRISAVKHSHMLVTNRPQHPPQACCYGAPGIVIGDDKRRRCDAVSFEHLGELTRRWKRMAPTTSG
jgi:hypothetical protein